MLVIVMCFGLNRSECLQNTLRFENQLGPGQILQVNCTSNRNEIKGIHKVKFDERYEILVNEAGYNRIVWRCHLRQGKKMEYFHTLWRAYRGASINRCGQIRAYIVALDRISLVRNDILTDEVFYWDVST